MLDKISEKIFYAGIICYFIYCWTYMSQLGAVHNWIWLLYLSMLLFVVKMILSKYSVVEIIICFFIMTVAILCSGQIGDITYATNCLILCSMKHIDLRKIMKIIMFVMAIIVTALIVWILITNFNGIVDIKDFGRGMVETRFRFAWWHANRFHFIYFMMSTIFLYCYNERCRWWIYILLTVFNVEILYLTRSRTGFMCAMFTIAIFALLKYIPRIFSSKVIYLLILAVILISIFGSIISMIKIDLSDSFWQKLNSLTTGRLWIAYDWYQRLGITMLGRPMDGLIPDMGVCRILLNYGVIMFSIIYGLILVSVYKFYIRKEYNVLLFLLTNMVYFTFEACPEAASDLRIFIIGYSLFKITKRV